MLNILFIFIQIVHCVFLIKDLQCVYVVNLKSTLQKILSNSIMLFI